MNLAQRSSNDLFKVTAENQGRSQSRNSGVSSPICNPLDHSDFAICQWDECSVLLSVLTNPFWHGFPSFGRAGAATEQRAGPALPQPLARPAPSRACVWVKLPVPFTAGTASVTRAGTPSFRNASPPKIPPRQGWRFIVTCPAEWHEWSHPSQPLPRERGYRFDSCTPCLVMPSLQMLTIQPLFPGNKTLTQA